MSDPVKFEIITISMNIICESTGTIRVPARSMALQTGERSGSRGKKSGVKGRVLYYSQWKYAACYLGWQIHVFIYDVTLLCIYLHTFL
jgi:hypothetical protein